MTRCPSCGAPLGAGARFCGNCGAALSDPADTWWRAEQSHHTVLCCDLVGSTQLFEQRGPEEYAYVLKGIRC